VIPSTDHLLNEIERMRVEQGGGPKPPTSEELARNIALAIDNLIRARLTGGLDDVQDCRRLLGDVILQSIARNQLTNSST
jgi:hypothetical protein